MEHPTTRLLAVTLITIGTLVCGCATYAETTTRRAFSELHDDAGDFEGALEICLRDTAAAAASGEDAPPQTCTQLTASINDLKDKAEEMCRIGLEPDEPCPPPQTSGGSNE